MNALTRTLVGIAFIGSAVVGPWWLTVLLGIVLLSQGVYGVVILGGVIMDFLFGAPLPALGNFYMLYTALFVILAIVAWYLNRQVLE